MAVDSSVCSYGSSRALLGLLFQISRTAFIDMTMEDNFFFADRMAQCNYSI